MAKKNSVEETEKKVEELEDSMGGKAALVKQFGMVDIKLNDPFTWCGETYEEVHLDFASMIGKDFQAIMDELEAMRVTVFRPQTSTQFQRKLAARASGMPEDALENLPFADYFHIVNAAQNFLLVTA
jgi:hypothetical protein